MSRGGWRRGSLTTPAAALTRPVRSPHPVREVPGAGVDAGEPLPVLIGGAPARQTGPTTCGSAVLVMLAATGDPELAAWLEAGTVPAALPPEVPADAAHLPDPADRFAAAQRRVLTRTGDRAVGPVRWPTALGTPPWTAAREARFAGVRYRSVPMDDRRDTARHLLASAHAATLAGVPVPLYTGGDLGRGITTAVPRHVVLAVPPPQDAPHRGSDRFGRRVLHLYEPAGATVRQVPLTDLLARDRPHPALGGWTHVCWVLLPVPDVAPGGWDHHTGSTDPRPKEKP